MVGGGKAMPSKIILSQNAVRFQFFFTTDDADPFVYICTVG